MYFLMNMGLNCRNIFHIALSLDGTEKFSIDEYRFTTTIAYIGVFSFCSSAVSVIVCVAVVPAHK